MTFLKQFMGKYDYSSKTLAADLKADGIEKIGDVSIRQWMRGGHKPYRTAIQRLYDSQDPRWAELAAALETDLEMARIDKVDTWEDVKSLNRMEL